MFLKSYVGRSRPGVVFPILNALILSALLVFTSACGTTTGGKQAADQDAVIVIFASSGALVKRGNENLPLKVGMLLEANDLLTTSNGTVDLQTKSGSLLRLRRFSKMRVARLMKGNAKENRFHLEHGGVLARVKRNTAREKFSVVTPTAIAGVRGTVFSVAVENGKKAKVKVISGKVAMRPHVPALEKFSKKQIDSTPHLKELNESLKKKEVVLGAKTEGKLHPRVEKEAAAVHKVLERHLKAGGKGKTAAIKKSTKTILRHEKAVGTQKKQLTPQEDAEHGTLVGVDQKLVNLALTQKAAPTPSEPGKKSGDNSGNKTEDRKEAKLNDGFTKQIAQDYDKKLNTAVNVVARKLEKKELKTNDEIRKHYKILEVVRLNSGGQKSGAVVAQAGNVLILHTTKGVVQIRKGNVQHIDYKHTN